MIICGFAGVGKTTLCRNHPNWIDLESTPFEKDWERYAKVAAHIDKQGYNVMLSCHKEIRETLHNNGYEYVIVIPNKDLKTEYISRYKGRGNDEKFISNIASNWDGYTSLLGWENNVVFLNQGEYITEKAVKG